MIFTSRYLSSNAISLLPEEVFVTLTSLHHLDLSSNAISLLPEEVFVNLTSLHHLLLASNIIQNITTETFSLPEKLGRR
ncbi:hypothetical protein ACROYT_G024612 [Oculina patagonica]